MWQVELKKIVPPPTSYNIKREFDKVDKHYKDDMEKAFKLNGCSFGVAYSNYQKVRFSNMGDYFFYRRAIYKKTLKSLITKAER